MLDIARLADVSPPTVSRALSGSSLVNEKTRAHIVSIAQQHGYTVNRFASKLRQKASHTVAVSIDFASHRQNHITDPFIFELLAGVSDALGNVSLDLLMTAPSHNSAEILETMLRSRGINGLIFLGQGHRQNVLNRFVELGVPMVVWGAKRFRETYCVVGSNNFLGGQLAGQYFLKHGCKNIIFVGDTKHPEIYWRYEGLKDVVAKTGKQVKVREMGLSNFSYDAAYDAALRFFTSVKSRPDAIFAFSDTAAFAIIHVLFKLGIRVPEDVHIVGYNDIPTAEFFSPALTTVRQDTHEAGYLLVNKLIRCMEGTKPKSQTIKTELVVRST